MGIARSSFYAESDGGRRRHRPGRGDARHQGRVRGLRLAADAGGASPPGLAGEPQEDQAPDARARPQPDAAPPLRGHDRQRPRPADLPRPGARAGRHRRPEPALGRRPYLCRDRGRLRLCCADHGRLVAPHRRLCHRPADRRPPDPGRARRRDRRAPSAARMHPPLGSRIASMPRRPTGTGSLAQASSARWAGAAIPTTTRWRRA